ADGLIVTGTFNAGAIIEESGEGTRMFFNPRDAAFRAGTVDGSEWDYSNIGYYSVAMGANTIASGQNAVAMGLNSDATNSFAAAIGWDNAASGNSSTALGQHNTAAGTASLATGAYTEAESAYETVLGRFDTDYTPSSATSWNAADRLFVVGNGSGLSTRSDAMVILKNGNTGIGTSNPTQLLHLSGVSGTDGIKFPDGTVQTTAYLTSNGNTLDGAYDQGGAGAGRVIDAVDGTVAITGEDGIMVSGTYGSGLAVGATGGIAQGAGTRMFFSPNKAAFRAGYVDGTQWDDANIGSYSTAMGWNTIASGSSSTAMGAYATASGDASTAMGYITTASGIASTAMGYDTEALGDYSTAMGGGTTASGDFSTAMGINTTAPSFAETAVGRYNTTYTPAGTSTWNAADRLFVVGNGTGTGANSSNALTITKDGTMNINDAYDMPTADGTANYVMSTDGVGVVSFVDPNTLVTPTTTNTLDGAYDQGGAGAGRVIDAV
ncbi:MAG: hypothetical protein GY918_14645, partial [Gammaproteobacteria bacterium]|nr:hypothetical protein [Gammaproteobacteria bacterium]